VGQALSRSGAGIDIFPGSEAQHAPHPISVNSGLAASSKPSSIKLDASKQKKTKTKTKKKKKKKKKNAIDDLFDGLL
jgi:ribonuclease MRP protein subunit RMP1